MTEFVVTGGFLLRHCPGARLDEDVGCKEERMTKD